MKNKTWVPIEEAIEQVARNKGISHRSAYRLLAKNVNDGVIRAKRAPKKHPPWVDLTPTETRRRLDAGEDHEVFISLETFRQYFKLSVAELMEELRSGRLIACSDASTRFEIELDPTKAIPISRFMVSIEAVEEWCKNPATPRGLFERLSK